MTPETDDPVPPWEQTGAIRRDCEPHRAMFLHSVAVIGFFCNLAGWLILPGIVGLSLSVMAWRLARQDLAAMAAGTMDPAGEKATQNVKKLATSSLVLTALWMVPLIAAAGILLISEFHGRIP